MSSDTLALMSGGTGALSSSRREEEVSARAHGKRRTLPRPGSQLRRRPPYRESLHDPPRCRPRSKSRVERSFPEDHRCMSADL